MSTLLNLPVRQKIVLGLTLAVGLFILFCSLTNILSKAAFNTMIFCYSLSVPLLLLTFETLIDLNKPNTFLIWYFLAIAFLIISLVTNGYDTFLINRSARFDKSYGVNSLLLNYSTSSLKALFAFLTVYCILNKLLKQFTGNFIINTFRQYRWFNSEANRKITGLDVILNLVLFLVIFAAALLG